MQLPPDSLRRVPSGTLAGGAVALTSFVWLLWQVWGIEIMRAPWEDEILYVLPAINWVKHGSFAIPQLGSFSGADISWGWHVPGFSLGMAAWLLVFPLELWSIRLFTLLPAAAVNALLLYVALRIGAVRSNIALFVWICIIYLDKSIVSQSLAGRMEFHALLLLLAALCFLLLLPEDFASPRVAAYTFISGFFFGLSAAFHPLTLYFGPALAIAALTAPCVRKNGFLVSAITGAAGAILPILAVAAWFYFAGPVAQQQFLLSVTGSSGEETRGSFRTIIDTIIFVYRFQPAMFFALILVLLVILVQWKSPSSNGRRGELITQRLLLTAATGIMCFMVAMLRGSTQHVNYYTILTVFFLLALIAAYVISQESLARAFRIFSATVICVLALNNTVFAAFKTYVVARNINQREDANLEAFLSAITQDPHTRYVLPPKLWLWAESKNLNWRVSYLTLVGQPPVTHAAYHEGTFQWSPNFIILDDNDWPERKIELESLNTFGFQQIRSYSRAFAHRGKYAAGWDLQVYQVAP
jgi:hypothetical protein